VNFFDVTQELTDRYIKKIKARHTTLMPRPNNCRISGIFIKNSLKYAKNEKTA
jgi:hypothetical protein